MNECAISATEWKRLDDEFAQNKPWFGFLAVIGDILQYMKRIWQIVASKCAIWMRVNALKINL